MNVQEVNNKGANMLYQNVNREIKSGEIFETENLTVTK